jgi:hypothetical protein
MLVRESQKTVSSGRPAAVAAQPLVHFDQWSADATVADSTIKITIALSGTISFDREIDMTGGPPRRTPSP